MKRVRKRIPVLERLAKEMTVLSAEEQRKFLGGGTGAQNDPYMQYEYDALRSVGSWSGGYVEGRDYVDANGFWGGSSGSSGNYGVNDNNGSSGNSGSGGYFDYGSGGDYGSGSGDGFGSGIGPQPLRSGENQAKWNSIKDGLLDKAQSKYNINLNDLTIIGVGNGELELGNENASTANAWIGEEWGQKVVCLNGRFFNLSDDTHKLRVLFEEYFHIKGDKAWDPDKKIEAAFTLPDPPDNIKSYIINDLLEGHEDEYQGHMTYSVKITDPNYYENEYNANKKVRDLMYNDLSEKEKKDIDYRIWYYGEWKKIAEKYHH